MSVANYHVYVNKNLPVRQVYMTLELYVCLNVTGLAHQMVVFF